MIVVEPLVYPPLCGVSLLEPFQGGVHLFAEMLGTAPVTHKRAGR